MGQEVWTSVLNHPIVDDLLKDRIPSVTDGYDDWFGLGGYFPEVVSKSEDRPIIIDGAEVSILAVRTPLKMNEERTVTSPPAL